MRRLTFILRCLNVLVILATFGAYLAPFISPLQFWPLNFLGMLFPWLLLFNLIFVAGNLVFRSKWIFFSLATIILGANHINSFLGFFPVKSFAEEESFIVASYNMAQGTILYSKDKKMYEQNTMIFNRFLERSVAPQILCLQEMNQPLTEQARKNLNLPYSHYLYPKGTGIFSTFPILDKGSIRFEDEYNKTNSCLWVDLDVYGERLRVYNVHLQSNKISSRTNRLLNNADFQEKSTYKDIYRIFGNIRYASRARVKQAALIKEHIQSCPYPVILAGDFNDTPQSYIYRDLSRGFDDGFCKKGYGFATTYAGAIPALRIDYILAQEELDFLDYWVPRAPYSDHYPVVSRLRWNEPTKKQANAQEE